MVGRRAVLKGGLALAFAQRVQTAQGPQSNDDPASARPKEGDLLVRVGDSTTMPLTPDDIPLAAMQNMAWAIDPKDRTVQRIAVESDSARAVRSRSSARRRGSPRPAASWHTRRFTHTGCRSHRLAAGRTTPALSLSLLQIDRKTARVVDGPAPRTLPALPLQVVEGKLAVAKPFLTRVGFDPA